MNSLPIELYIGATPPNVEKNTLLRVAPPATIRHMEEDRYSKKIGVANASLHFRAHELL